MSTTIAVNAVYGDVPHGLVEVPAGAVQCSPRVPGSASLDGLTEAGSDTLVMHAPPSALERRRELALALRALKPGAVLTVLAANTKGGNRIAGELTGFGCDVTAAHKRHHQIVRTLRGTAPLALDEALAAGVARLVPELGLWSQPGLFSWDRIDPGSKLLLDHLPPLAGRGADLGCGIGILARAVRERSPATELALVDVDRRAIDCARRNVPGEGVTTHWADIRASTANRPASLDFIVTNPPFHDGGPEDKSLGQAFIRAAAAMLRPGGELWLTANRHLPYETTLQPLFGTLEKVVESGGYKVYRAVKATRAAAPITPARGKPRR